jgi:hypothetical protein
VHVLESLAAYLKVNEAVTTTKMLLDPSINWTGAKNIWNNAAIRTMFYVMAAPIRWVRR